MYELSLIDLVDDDGLTFSFYHFEAIDPDTEDWPWLQGIKFDSAPSGKIRLKIDLSDPDAGEFADCIGSYPPLLTARFKAVLDSCGVKNVEYFPVELEGAERFDEIPEYFAFNVIGKARPSAAMPAGLEIARNSGMLAVLLVSDAIRDACKEAGVDTLRFNLVGRGAGGEEAQECEAGAQAHGHVLRTGR